MPNLLMGYGDRLKLILITSLVYTDGIMKDEEKKKKGQITARVRKEKNK